MKHLQQAPRMEHKHEVYAHLFEGIERDYMARADIPRHIEVFALEVARRLEEGCYARTYCWTVKMPADSTLIRKLRAMRRKAGFRRSLILKGDPT